MLASRVGSTYEEAEVPVRRQPKQAIVDQVLIEVDGSVAYARMQHSFAALRDTEFRKLGEVSRKGVRTPPRRRFERDSHGGRYRTRTCDLSRVKAAL